MYVKCNIRVKSNWYSIAEKEGKGKWEKWNVRIALWTFFSYTIRIVRLFQKEGSRMRTMSLMFLVLVIGGIIGLAAIIAMIVVVMKNKNDRDNY